LKLLSGSLHDGEMREIYRCAFSPNHVFLCFGYVTRIVIAFKILLMPQTLKTSLSYPL